MSRLKEKSACAALDYIGDNMIIGVGTGSTVNIFIDHQTFTIVERYHKMNIENINLHNFQSRVLNFYKQNAKTQIIQQRE